MMDIEKMYTKTIEVLGGGEDLIDECETTTSYSISLLYPEFKGKLIKVMGTFEGKGHFWVELENQIIDLSIEQFGHPFQFPVSAERSILYNPIHKILVSDEVYHEAVYLSEISGF